VRWAEADDAITDASPGGGFASWRIRPSIGSTPGISQLVNLLRPEACQTPCQLEQLHKWPQLCPLLG